MPFLFASLCVCILGTSAIPVDNDVDGEPVVECGSHSLAVAFLTRNRFQGQTFAKGFFNDYRCRNQTIVDNMVGILVPFNDCGVTRRRSHNPTGVLYQVTVVIQFHEKFITKVDRAYSVSCLYKQAGAEVSSKVTVDDVKTDEKTVESKLPLSTCRYEILNSQPSAGVVHDVAVGQPLHHRWSCKPRFNAAYCLFVHTCSVSNDAGEESLLTDDEGCSLDRRLFSDIFYRDDLTAGQNSVAFKFADQSVVYFKCRISLLPKSNETTCRRPDCTKATRKRKREGRKSGQPHEAVGMMTVFAQPLIASSDQKPEGVSDAENAAAESHDIAISLYRYAFPVTVVVLMVSIILLNFFWHKNFAK